MRHDATLATRDAAADNARAAIDVSELPSFAFGEQSVMWWGTLGIMAIEGMVFALMIGTYFYVRTRADSWPPGVAPPDLRYGTANLIILLLSTLPNAWTKRAAERYDLAKVRMGLVVCLAFAVAFLVVRTYEFMALNVRWDTNAYGSATWTLLGLHTTHLATDAADTAVLTALMFTRNLEAKRFADVSENALYWYFVVASWVPIYAVLYLAPRYA